MTQKLIYKTETDYQTQKNKKKKPMVTKGEREQERDKLGIWDQQIQANIHKIGRHKVLLYSTGNYTQYPVMSHNGKEHKKECVCVCV